MQHIPPQTDPWVQGPWRFLGLQIRSECLPLEEFGHRWGLTCKVTEAGFQELARGDGASPQVEGRDRDHEQVVPDECGNQRLPAQAPIQERAGDTEHKPEQRADTRKMTNGTHTSNGAVNQVFG